MLLVLLFEGLWHGILYTYRNRNSCMQKINMCLQSEMEKWNEKLTKLRQTRHLLLSCTVA